MEGEDIYIESTTAEVVRGNNVTIGPRCNIEILAYKDKIFVAPNLINR